MKFPSEIFGGEKNERQSSEIPRASSPLALTYSALVGYTGRPQSGGSSLYELGRW